MPQLCTAWVMVTVTPATICDPPLFMGQVFATPFEPSHSQVS